MARSPLNVPQTPRRPLPTDSSWERPERGDVHRRGQRRRRYQAIRGGFFVGFPSHLTSIDLVGHPLVHFREVLILKLFQDTLDLCSEGSRISSEGIQATLHRYNSRFRNKTHGNQNAIERVFNETKAANQSVLNHFRHTSVESAESWLQILAFAWNQLICTRSVDCVEKMKRSKWK